MTARQPNLYLPGRQRNGQPRTYVEIPGYWDAQRSEQGRGGAGEAYEVELARHLRARTGMPIVGLVCLDSVDTRTGRVLQRSIGHNVELDFFVNAALKLLGTGAAVTALGQYLALDTATATAVMSGGTITSGSQSAIVVTGNAFTGAVVTGNAAASFQAAGSNNGTGTNVTTPGATAPDATYGTGIAWSFGTANVEYVSGTTGSATSSSIPITAYTVTKTHTAGDPVIAFPSTKDGPAGAPGGLIVAAGTATTTYTTTAGIGNRKAQLVYTFLAGAYATALYTGLWVATYSTAGAYAASGNYVHASNAPTQLNATTAIVATYTAIY